MLSPAVPSPDLAVPCIVAGELAALYDPGLMMTVVGPVRQLHVLTPGPRPSGLNLARARAPVRWAASLTGRATLRLFWPGRHKALFLFLFLFLFLWLFQKFHRINY